jgi:hypothetical protein
MFGRIAGAGVAAGVLIAVLTSGFAFGAQGASKAGARVAPKQWWGTVCSDLVSYTNDTARFERTLVAALDNPKSPSDVKAKLITFLTNNLTRVKSLLAALKRAGVPNAPGGAEYASSLQSGFGQLVAGFKGLIPEARAAPTGSMPALQSAVNVIHGELITFGAQGANTEAAARQRSSPELIAARQQQPACKSLSN